MNDARPADTEHVVYVAVARELLPRLNEWSRPVRLKVTDERDGVAVLLLQDIA